jgi:hypothetical protein
MGLFSSRGRPGEFPVDDSAIANTYANQVWIIQNRREIILQWCCIPENEPARAQQDVAAVALGMSYFMAKRLLLALDGVVRQHESEYGNLDLAIDERETEDRIALSRPARGDLELDHPEAREPPRFAPALPAAGANFCRVSVTPEELILDFGMNTLKEGGDAEPIRLTHRLVMSFTVAKSTRNRLRTIIEDYERRNGAIELDFQKRLRRRN